MVLLALLSACHRVPLEQGPWLVPAPTDGWRLRTADNTAERRFDLVLRNESDTPIYIHVHSWPSVLGQMHFALDTVFIETEEQRHFMVERNMGVCVAPDLGCFIEIRPAEKLSGFLAYSEFWDLPPDATTCPKELSFAVEPLVEEPAAEHVDVIEALVDDAARDRRYPPSIVCVRALDNDILSSAVSRLRDGWVASHDREVCGEYSRETLYVAVQQLERSGRTVTALLVTDDGFGAEYQLTARWGRDGWSIRDKELAKIE